MHDHAWEGSSRFQPTYSLDTKSPDLDGIDYLAQSVSSISQSTRLSAERSNLVGNDSTVDSADDINMKAEVRHLASHV
jgi:hypothetical protein